MKKYDGFEIALVNEFVAPDGTLYAEARVTLDDEVDEDAVVNTYWTLYGHTEYEGVEALIDRKHLNDLLRIFGRLTGHHHTLDADDGVRFYFDENGQET